MEGICVPSEQKHKAPSFGPVTILQRLVWPPQVLILELQIDILDLHPGTCILEQWCKAHATSYHEAGTNFWCVKPLRISYSLCRSITQNDSWVVYETKNFPGGKAGTFLKECWGTSVAWAFDSWFQLWSWPWTHEIEPQVGLCAQHGVSWSLSLCSSPYFVSLR